jgi:hypothetical protein
MMDGGMQHIEDTTVGDKALYFGLFFPFNPT